MPRIPLAAYEWVRGHSVHIVRLAVVLVVVAVTVLAGYTCHGLIGPPG
ncbi:MAG: hypothetical protein PVJ64_11925 [Gemmatimonadales bacterium]|jgi:hypothetical protein